MRGKSVIWPIIAAMLVGVATPAAAQTAPRSAKIVVTFPAGGTADVLARLVADQMSRARDASVIIDNRPGANSIVGNEYAARAAPDGATMLMVANSFLITSFLRQLPYDTMKSFAPVASLVESPLVIAVRDDAPYKTLADLVAAAKAKPGALSNAAIGPATAQRVALEFVKRAAGIDVNFVPYQSNALALNALLGGDVTSVTVNIADLAGMVADHRVRVLATLSAKRIAGWDQTPTAQESGVNVAYSAWFGLLAPAATPPAIVDDLGAWAAGAIDAPETRAKLKPLEFYPSVLRGADFAGFLRAENEATERIVRETGIRME